jgi:2Fe-2S ferredoxin
MFGSDIAMIAAPAMTERVDGGNRLAYRPTISDSDHAEDHLHRAGRTERTVEAEVGATVMETAINNDIPGIPGDLRRLMLLRHLPRLCGRGLVEQAAAAGAGRSDMLDTAHDLQDNSRLSCQIVVSEELDGLTVTTPPGRF